MLFAAGVGIGLMFYGVAEPVVHYLRPPVGEGAAVGGENQAVNLTMLHWGFNAWSVYALMALVLAYFSFRRGLPLTLRSAFYPILGDASMAPGERQSMSSPSYAPPSGFQLAWARRRAAEHGPQLPVWCARVRRPQTRYHRRDHGDGSGIRSAGSETRALNVSQRSTRFLR